MNTAKQVVAVAGMFLLTASGFWAFAALVQYRIGQPVVSASELHAGVQLDRQRLLRAGPVQSIDSAVRALRRHDRSRATAALDAAKRVTEVGRDVAPGTALQGAHEAIRAARLALQDGRTASAVSRLEQAAALLRSGVALPGPGLGGRQEGQGFDGYGGAIVLNALGVRIGEVECVRGTEFQIVIGGQRDVLGFIDLPGGRHAHVPASQLILGKIKRLGSTMVVLPTLATSPDASSLTLLTTAE